jgi:hypothetical protein
VREQNLQFAFDCDISEVELSKKTRDYLTDVMTGDVQGCVFVQSQQKVYLYLSLAGLARNGLEIYNFIGDCANMILGIKHDIHVY